MFRFFGLLSVFVIVMTGCNAVATPIPAATNTARATATSTVSVADLTAGASVRLTLPASFTPTFTPTITLTPLATNTATITPTTTPIPEDILCEEFTISPVFTDEATDLDTYENLIQIYLPYEHITVTIDIYDTATDELVEFGTLTGGFPAILDVSPQYFPVVGEYEWVMTIQDDTRSGLCERRGTFETREEELAQDDASTTPAPESTGEVSAETTSEANTTGGLVISSEATAELTEEADDTVPFPPR